MDKMRSPIFSVEVSELNPYLERSIDEPDDKRAVYMFHNGYGASVIHHSMSYGVELAVLGGIDTVGICYDTPITSDVVGNIQNGDELLSLLLRVKDLPSIKEGE